MSEPEKHEFKAEIKKLLHLLSQSLYQHKEIFLRELISNASDALKKIQFLSLQNQEDIESPELPFEIEVGFHKKGNTITVKDTGIGMSKEEMIENLGTIAQSGTEKFVQKLKESQEHKESAVDLDIIGQFGVGFYSVFMVADKVQVISKSYLKDQPANIWESDGSGEFTVEPSDRTSRGTDVIIYLKSEESEYLSKTKLESIIKKYSNFVPFPIYVTEYKTEEELQEEAEKKKAEEAKKKEAEKKKKEEAKQKESKKAKKGKKKQVSMGEEEEAETPEAAEEEQPEQPEEEPEETSEEEADETEEKPEAKPAERKAANEIEPLWKKDAKEIKDEEYKNFYHFISNRYDEYSDVINFNIDGQVQFHSILYVPEKHSKDLFAPEMEYGLALYSKNVMIIQSCKELIPKWMRFMAGVVDSDDIPLNISRETIQNNRLIIKINELVTNKVISELASMAEKDPEKYAKFWKEFGVLIKEGIVTEYDTREKLLKLLRFQTSKSKSGELRSLDDYVKNMKEDQKEIFYLVGENINTLKISPHIGYYNTNDLEVIFFTEPVDNFLMMNLPEYTVKVEKTEGEGEEKPEGEAPKEQKYPFSSIDTAEKSKKETKGKDKDKETEEETEETEGPEPDEDTKQFLDHVKQILGDKIMDAKLSNRLYGNACRLANPPNGMTSTMQRAMRYWTQTNYGKEFQIPRKILEFNSENPMVQELVKLYKENPESGKIKPVVQQLFENCLLIEGDLPDPSLMVPRMNQLLEMLITGRDDVKNPVDDLPPEEPPAESESELEEDNVPDEESETGEEKSSDEDSIKDAEIVSDDLESEDSQ